MEQRKIHLLISASVNVTEDEYEKLRSLAEDKYADDVIYNDILAPDWLINKVKRSGEIGGDGFISSTQWMGGVANESDY